MFELILIRHGETIFNSEERLQGSQDSRLTPRGENEARQLGSAMRKFCGPIHAWYVSPQGRARQTSALLRDEIGTDPDASTGALPDERVHDEIAEIRCGDWEGLRRAEISADELKRVHQSTDVAYPNGESIVDVSGRCESFLEDWRRELPAYLPTIAEGSDDSGGDAIHRTVIVSHGNLIRCMGGVLSGLGPDFAIRVMKNNTGVTRFFIREHPARDQKAIRALLFRLLTWNNTSHLSGGDPFFSV